MTTGKGTTGKGRAPRFPEKGVRDALDEALAGSTLEPRNAPAVATARVLADRIDELAANGFLDGNGKLDNVSVPTFLRYLVALGLVEDPAHKHRTKAPEEPEDKPKGRETAVTLD